MKTDLSPQLGIFPKDLHNNLRAHTHFSYDFITDRGGTLAPKGT